MAEKVTDYTINPTQSDTFMSENDIFCQVAPTDLRVKLDKLDKNIQSGRKNE